MRTYHRSPCSNFVAPYAINDHLNKGLGLLYITNSHLQMLRQRSTFECSSKTRPPSMMSTSACSLEAPNRSHKCSKSHKLSANSELGNASEKKRILPSEV